jgi:GNAT superfamily N-acetyltransferase
MLNRALGLGVREAATEGALDEIMAFRAGVEWYVALAPQAKWHCFVAFDGETPAGAGALFIAGEVGWLGIAGTIPEHRGKGAQGAILARRIEAAAATGCALVVTETGEPRDGQPGASYRSILRAGFEPQYVRPNYLSSPEADTSGTTP